ncbi:MAG TPA: hypothetical protein ENI90_01185 [Methylothermaceae bacterium]|nr:hypothetical protein [Methylothermaceae bacterium]
MADHRPIHLAPPGGEISRRDLNTLIRRFLHLQRQRRQLLLRGLHPRQRDCLEILPLLFHAHHPALPGYGDPRAPAGISDYRLSPSTRKACKRLAPGFDPRRQGIPEPPIQALFLMGSAGSIAFGRNSDLDLWICHRSDLDHASLAALRHKCREIENWITGYGLELHCFLVDPQRLRRGELEPLSQESSGSTQHVLLLEEFYRTSIHLAGSRPLWWLVPPQWETRYQDYVDFLVEKRFIDATAFVDLGGLAPVPAREFASAGLWHLHKALESPYKALLKLLLLCDYANDFPHPRWLASDIKRAVYDGRIDAVRLDPYLQLYRRIETAIRRQGQNDLLPLVQQSFAMKIRDARYHPDYRRLLTDLQRQWGRLSLSRRPHCPVESATTEWRALTRTLEAAHAQLLRFATGVRGERGELHILENKLRASLKPHPGKVPLIRLSVTPESHLSLDHDGQQPDQTWRLFRWRSQTLLHQDSSLIGLLAWAWGNRIVTPATEWHLPQGQNLTLAELLFLSRGVRRFFADMNQPAMAVYARPPRLRRCALFANIATATRPQRGDFEITSDRFDPLNYGAERLVLLKHVEILTRNSWGEIEVRRYDLLEGLFDAYCWLHGHGGEGIELTGYCFSAPTLGLRLESLYRQICRQLSEPPAAAVVEAGGRQYRLHHRRGQLVWHPLNPA